jgi:hypothetical protein
MHALLVIAVLAGLAAAMILKWKFWDWVGSFGRSRPAGRKQSSMILPLAAAVVGGAAGYLGFRSVPVAVVGALVGLVWEPPRSGSHAAVGDAPRGRSRARRPRSRGDRHRPQF